ncbi:TetR family transcriptional regulator [filamentous cyanobacterium LEGE 11480]|uniref:TetR family transcriptional regulator n=1 Tax=Romeriopsis navalis LEGE 11480 TaxID=2777977 RepID=A0A928Z6X1_9CYAN|nr:TetR family transcriptional regulator [Romeriopsis navalis]MBE9033437.1 TetR family transcriptional regulator [Romeriopsis navalis LEGE 11480]
MASKKKSTKARLIDAALELFIDRGITDTTTKAIAERAEVNEVTLFRHFGNKNGLLIAILTDDDRLPQLGQRVIDQMSADPSSANPTDSLSQALTQYSQASLDHLTHLQNLIHSIIGEAHQAPPENRQALSQGLKQTNQPIAEYFTTAIAQTQNHSNFPPETLTSLLHSLLIGYFILQTTSDNPTPWNSQADFLSSLTTLFLKGAIVQPSTTPIATSQTPAIPTAKINDLPAPLVRDILQRAKKLGRQEYAFAYLLFATGLTPDEILNLETSHYIPEPGQHLIQINTGSIRQVPLTQWIAGKRYGSDNSNPLNQWIKSRKDEHNAIFLNPQTQPLISTAELQTLWNTLTADLLTPQGQSPTIDQAHQTWCVEMLIKGIDLENLSLLSGIPTDQLEPFAQRAKVKAAIDQASQLDKQS